jgi:hypothetical protein
LNKLGYNLDVDGAIGTNTLTALNDALDKCKAGQLMSHYFDEQMAYYNNIITNQIEKGKTNPKKYLDENGNPKSLRFLKGWGNRMTWTLEGINKIIKDKKYTQCQNKYPSEVEFVKEGMQLRRTK